MPDRVTENCRIPLKFADVSAGVGVQEQLHRVKAVSGLRLVRAMDTIAIDLAWPDLRQPPMKDLIRVFRQHHSLKFGLALSIEQANFSLGGMGGEESEVHSLAIPMSAKRIGRAFANATLEIIHHATAPIGALRQPRTGLPVPPPFLTFCCAVRKGAAEQGRDIAMAASSF